MASAEKHFSRILRCAQNLTCYSDSLLLLLLLQTLLLLLLLPMP